tara:strand:+ start:815 stop:1453 length:639 start_codon:yes stop_codon:yes gene_type:complete
MKNHEMINKIKTLLNIEVKLEEAKLENGTIVEAESFEKGKEIFIKTDDERVAMPVGEYMLEDGKLVVVEEEGIIADLRDPSDEVPAKEDAESEEETEDLEDKKEDEMADEGNYVTKDSFREMEVKIQNLEDAISDLKGDKESKMEDQDEEVEMEDEVSRQPKSRTIKEEFSEAAAKPIKHNPEASFDQVKSKVFGKGNYRTTLDRVLEKLNK